MTVTHAREASNGLLLQAEATARESVRAALDIAQSTQSNTFSVWNKGATGDLVTDVDLRSQRRMIEIILSRFPDHNIISEEEYTLDLGSRWTWIVDPLDGTNNFAIGLPMFGASVVLHSGGVPQVACTGDAYSRDLISSVRRRGLQVNGIDWSPPEKRLHRQVSALWLGYENRADDRASAARAMLNSSTQRLFENWAPTIDVALYLNGYLDVVVGLGCEGTEVPAALTILESAGASIVTLDGNAAGFIPRSPDLFVAGRANSVRPVVERLRRLF